MKKKINENKVSIYLKSEDRVKIRYYQQIYMSKYNVGIPFSKVLNSLINSKYTIDDMIQRLNNIKVIQNEDNNKEQQIS